MKSLRAARAGEAIERTPGQQLRDSKLNFHTNYL